MKTTPALLALCLLGAGAASFAGCGSSTEEPGGEEAADAFMRRGGFSRQCLRKFAECTANSCAPEIDDLRQARPFMKEWFTAFVRTKICAVVRCGAACSSTGTGGSSGAGGSSGQGGAGGSAGTGQGGSAGNGSVCDLSANACQACLCKPCATQVAACNADSACRAVVTCGMRKSCTGVDCYFQADGSRGPCADEIDAAGGPAGASVAKALDVLRCTEPVRPTCSACN